MKVFRHDHRDGDQENTYTTHGYSYGTDPVPVPPSQPQVEYITPAPKYRQHQNDSQTSLTYMEPSSKTSTDKKRKRSPIGDLDLTAARRPSQEPLDDTHMSDAPAPPTVLHSGLTGGLNRLLSKSHYPPSPDYSGKDENGNPASPAKRSKSISTTTTSYTIPKEKEKDRGISRSRNGALVKVRKRRSSDESRPPQKKQQRSHDHHDELSKSKPRPKAIEDTPVPSKQKAITSHAHTSHHSHDKSSQQLTIPSKSHTPTAVSRASLFLSCVTKGPESESGYSVHKALKRYHREREDSLESRGLGSRGATLEKVEEEKELWRGLRLKRNERGEVVVFF